jgi:hypothetical protein
MMPRRFELQILVQQGFQAVTRRARSVRIVEFLAEQTTSMK